MSNRVFCKVCGSTKQISDSTTGVAECVDCGVKSRMYNYYIRFHDSDGVEELPVPAVNTIFIYPGDWPADGYLEIGVDWVASKSS